MRLRRALRSLRHRIARGPTEHREIFSRIYCDNAWGDVESVSGPGSSQARAASFVEDLATALRQLEVRVLLDAPCGDFNWAAPFADAVDRYVGVDVVPELIEANAAHHGGPRRQFLPLDITRDTLPTADAVLCRDCLVHFSFADVWTTLRNFERSGTRYLITTTFIDRATNHDVRTGQWRTLNLQVSPFAFPPPLLLVDERCTDWAGHYRDKRLAVWPLASLKL
jgi:hypothetical protein